MSMLAETRRKGKWSYNPNGLKNGGDHEKKGKSLLEKLGWSEGQGLGKSNQGRVDPITLKVKNDAKGVGFTGRAEATLSHQDDFESMLVNLATSHDNSAANSPSDQNLHDSKSENVKRDRKRYHKSRSAKDISRYSSKDLEGIVGSSAKKRKAMEPIVTVDTLDPHNPVNDADEDGIPIRPSFSQDAKIEQNGATSVIQNSEPPKDEKSDHKFKQGGDINAYFARKMEEKKKSKESKDMVSNESKSNDIPNIEEEENAKKKNKKDKKSKKSKKDEITLPQTIEQNNAKLVTQNSEPKENEKSDSKVTHGGDMNAYFARKMEEKKKSKESNELVSNDSKSNDSPNIKEEEHIKKKKKKDKKSKKSKKDRNMLEQTVQQNGATLVKQNSELKETEKNDSKFTHGGDINAYFARKMEEKKKSKQSKDMVSNDIPNIEEEENAKKKKKKDKKSKKSKKDKNVLVQTMKENGATLGIQNSEPKENAKSDSKLTPGGDVNVYFDRKMAEKQKSKESKDIVSNDSKENDIPNIKEEENVKKKKKKAKETKLKTDDGDLVGFQGTNILSIKGYGIKSK